MQLCIITSQHHWSRVVEGSDIGLCIHKTHLADEYWETGFSRANHPASEITIVPSGGTAIRTGGDEWTEVASEFEGSGKPQD